MTVVALLVALFGLFDTQLIMMVSESGDGILDDMDSNTREIIVTILLVLIVLPAFLVNLFSPGLFEVLMIALPILGMVGLLVGTVTLAALRVLYGVCYCKVLRMYVSPQKAKTLSCGCAIRGLFPVVLLIAGKKREGEE